MKIKEYEILTADSVKEMETNVNRYINAGFEPFGQLVVVASGEAKHFYQPVIKYQP